VVPTLVAVMWADRTESNLHGCCPRSCLQGRLLIGCGDDVWTQGAVAIQRKMVEYNSSEEGARAVRDRQLSAFICDYPVAQYFTQVGVADAAAGSKVV